VVGDPQRAGAHRRLTQVALRAICGTVIYRPSCYSRNQSLRPLSPRSFSVELGGGPHAVIGGRNRGPSPIPTATVA
jgi:hypothetical protein